MKKKRWSLYLGVLLLLAFLLPALVLPAAAADERTLPLVCDVYGLLTQEEEDALNETAEAYSKTYSCDIVLIVTSDTEGYGVEDYTEAVYNQFGFGWGEERSGVILLLSMAERDYDLAAYGYGNVAFTDYGKEWLMDEVLPYLGNDDWYAGFSRYLDLCADYLRQAREGNPVDYYGSGSGPVTRQRGFFITPKMVVLALVVGFIPAIITVLVLRGKMKSAVLQARADNYRIRELQLTEQNDIFVKKNVSRVRRDTSSGSRSGGGHGTSVRSSGFSHHSGKF